MKKWIAVLCAVILGFSVTGCGQTKEASVKKLLSEKPSGEITVSCYDTMFYKDFLEKAAKAFEKKNPDTKIKVESFAPMPEIKESQNGDSTISVVSTGNDEQERADYISKINTELMSGEGADVLAIDILPYYKYADGGQLEDLQAYMDADSSFDIKDYRKNILDAVKYHGGQYMMPLDYRFDYLAYDASLFTENEQQSLSNNSRFTYEQLIEAGKVPFQRVNANSKEPVRMFGITAGPQMFRELLLTDYGKYIDIEGKKVNLTDGSFTKLLETAKKYGEDGYLKPDLTAKADSAEISIENFEKMKAEQFFFKTKNSFSLLNQALKNAGTNGAYSFDAGAGNESNDKTLGLLTNKNGDINFNYYQAYGINSNSENKALAWAFVKFLMSEEIEANQELSMIGFPVNNAARMEKAKMDISGMSFNKDLNQNKELTVEQKKAYDTYINAIEEFSESLNYYPIEDDNINTMIDKEVAHYFDGTKSADEVAKTLQEKIELYLNE